MLGVPSVRMGIGEKKEEEGDRWIGKGEEGERCEEGRGMWESRRVQVVIGVKKKRNDKE